MAPFLHDTTSVEHSSTRGFRGYWRQPNLIAVDESEKLLKRGVWLYFFLLIFEGALRKWFFPGLATPLLVVRDPLALWLIVATWQKGLLPTTMYIMGVFFIGTTGLFTSTLLGHGNILVALYGARILLIHFPLIFVIGRIFNREDVLKIGKATLYLAIPMAVLIALQFYSPQSAWVNRGVGGSLEGAGFSGALGYFRPPGTFSFTNGNTLFFGLVSVFIFYFWINVHDINRFLLIGATIALLIAIPLSISRSLFFQVGLSLLFSCFAISRKPKYLGKVLVFCIGIGLAFFFLSQTSLFSTAVEAFTARFVSANESEGGLSGVLVDRYLGGLVGSLSASSELPFFGHGLGMGTNVGSMLLTGDLTYLISEGEWGRLIGELGALMGLAVIFLRLALCVNIVWASYHKLMLGDLLPWMLLSFGLLVVPQGQWAQPTSLGFSTLIGGLMLASLRVPKSSV
ncbi:membrane protein [Pontibacter korlensis]|uniref:Membrane protein n=1 Tax=Pontibacter korlensis TaxID=400092 RepID=A0A0E3ZG82_9BACT|nr:hypothetical protein [Pontibacter korlensis]AKD03983.1 membrane protein [Pontibacter korlensis]